MMRVSIFNDQYVSRKFFEQNCGFHDVRFSEKKELERKLKYDLSFRFLEAKILKKIFTSCNAVKMHEIPAWYAVKMHENFFISSAATITVTILAKLRAILQISFLFIPVRLG